MIIIIPLKRRIAVRKEMVIINLIQFSLIMWMKFEFYYLNKCHLMFLDVVNVFKPRNFQNLPLTLLFKEENYYSYKII